jgi:hypothetical protein
MYPSNAYLRCISAAKQADFVQRLQWPFCVLTSWDHNFAGFFHIIPMAGHQHSSLAMKERVHAFAVAIYRHDFML